MLLCGCGCGPFSSLGDGHQAASTTQIVQQLMTQFATSVLENGKSSNGSSVKPKSESLFIAGFCVSFCDWQATFFFLNHCLLPANVSQPMSGKVNFYGRMATHPRPYPRRRHHRDLRRRLFHLLERLAPVHRATVQGSLLSQE